MDNSDKFVLGLDFGGTNIRVAAVSFSGEIIARAQGKTPHRRPSDETVAAIVDVIEKCLSSLDRNGVVGLGAAAPIATFGEDGVLGSLPNIPALNGVDLRQVLSDRFGFDVLLVNDATAATVGEHWLGASNGFENVIGLTLGTGLGGGLIIDGKVYEGGSRTAGEIGHMGVEPDGVPCPCGSHGCVEQYASGTAIMRYATENGLAIKDPHEAFDLAKNGDEKAVAIFNAFGRYLGIALAGLVNVLNPDAIVIGGGVAASWDLFIGPLNSEVQKRAFHEQASRVKIIRAASLGDDAGVLGAVRMTLEKLA